LYKNKDVIVAGGGDSAVEAAIDLARIAKSVKVVQRSVFRANRISVDKLLSLNNVQIFLNTQIRSINGDGQKLTSVTAFDKAKEAEFDLEADGLFVEIGSNPMSNFVKDLVELNDIGEIVVNKKAETNIAGIYAAGDVTNSSYKQIIIAAAEGAKAALSASDYLNRLKVKVLGGENGIFK
jgi:alkyl hydroperoxide reductase subunit AhpF